MKLFDLSFFKKPVLPRKSTKTYVEDCLAIKTTNRGFQAGSEIYMIETAILKCFSKTQTFSETTRSLHECSEILKHFQ